MHCSYKQPDDCSRMLSLFIHSFTHSFIHSLAHSHLSARNSDTAGIPEAGRKETGADHHQGHTSGDQLLPEPRGAVSWMGNQGVSEAAINPNQCRCEAG